MAPLPGSADSPALAPCTDADATPAAAASAEEEERPLTVFYFGGGPGDANLPEARHSHLRGRSSIRDFVSPKIGTRQAGAVGQVARDTQWVREDTEARARSVLHRQQCDTVGSLLGWSGSSAARRSNSVGAVAEASAQSRENAAGRFLYRVRDAGPHFEVEAKLSGGRLLRVLRNPLRRTLTFEGEMAAANAPGAGRWSPTSTGAQLDRAQPGPELAEERLVVRIPPGYDLMGPPAHVERAFSEGHCLVALHRCGGQRNTRALSWAGGEL